MSNKKYVIDHDNDSKLSIYSDNKEEHDNLLPGLYKAKSFRIPFGGTMVEIYKGEMFQMCNNPLSIVRRELDLSYILDFFSESSVKIHKELGSNLKMGLLFGGTQGTGKTTGAYGIAELFIKKYNAIVFEVSSYPEIDYTMDMAKNYQKDTDSDQVFIFIVDECEDVFQRNEPEMKSLLDGTGSANNFLFIGMTNYMEEIPDTIKDRPSRFKYVLDFTKITDEITIHYLLIEMNDTLSNDFKLTEKELKIIIKNLDKKGYSIDELKHIFNDFCIKKSIKNVGESEKFIKNAVEKLKLNTYD